MTPPEVSTGGDSGRNILEIGGLVLQSNLGHFGVGIIETRGFVIK